MNEERVKFEGKLGIAMRQAEEYRLKIARLVREMRNDLDPTVDAENLPALRVLQQADELSSTHTELSILMGTIREYEEILGRRYR